MLPDGVLLRFVYSAATIVAAWLAVEPQPIGLGQNHATAYARLGVDRLRLERHRSGGKRWRAVRWWAERFLTHEPGTTWSQRMRAFLIDHALRGAAV